MLPSAARSGLSFFGTFLVSIVLLSIFYDSADIKQMAGVVTGVSMGGGEATRTQQFFCERPFAEAYFRLRNIFFARVGQPVRRFENLVRPFAPSTPNICVNELGGLQIL